MQSSQRYGVNNLFFQWRNFSLLLILSITESAIASPPGVFQPFRLPLFLILNLVFNECSWRLGRCCEPQMGVSQGWGLELRKSDNSVLC